LEKEEKRQSPYVMSALFLKDKEVHDNIRRLWVTHHYLSFYGKIRRCIKYYRLDCMRKAAERKQEEEHLRNQLENRVARLQNNPGHPELQVEVTAALDQLKDLEYKKIAGQQLRGRLKWKKDGDQDSKTFFRAHTERTASTQITELEDRQGRVHNNQATHATIYRDYYSALYLARTPTPASLGAGT
jgi:hypothetical protein